MAEFFNSSASFISDNWAGYLAQAPAVNTRYVLLALLNIPVLAVLINVLQQLVCPAAFPVIFSFERYPDSAQRPDQTSPCLPLAPLCWLWRSVRTRPAQLFLQLPEKGALASCCVHWSLTVCQYGDCFTFVLFGRRVTVLLGAKGNNFVLGGKSTVFNAEDAYTVSLCVLFRERIPMSVYST